MVISDYLKGAISRAVAAAVIEIALRAQRPVLVDPKVPHIDYYRAATLITPNHHEAEAVAHMRIRSEDDAREAARRFRERSGCENVLITRGEHGMHLHTPQGDTALPAEAREVSDVTGAGDTVIGTMALALAAGGTLLDSARLANRAAGIVVGKFGPSTVSVAELGKFVLTLVRDQHQLRQQIPVQHVLQLHVESRAALDHAGRHPDPRSDLHVVLVRQDRVDGTAGSETVEHFLGQEIRIDMTPKIEHQAG